MERQYDVNQWIIAIFLSFSVRCSGQKEIVYDVSQQQSHPDFDPGVYFLRTKNGTNNVVNMLNDTSGIHPNANANNFDWSTITKSVKLQPCRIHDSCRDRCLDFPRDTTTVAETYFFNCNCDPYCTIFRDCCWDYEDECGRIDHKGSVKASHKPEARPRTDAFECTVVDKYSKDYFWVVTKCATSWPNDEIRRQCNSVVTDFITLLPVQGDTGWTYKNAFCAQCNYVRNYEFWEINARCFQSAPDEVLNGSSDMISYYLIHFCNIQLARTQDLMKSSGTEPQGKNASLGMREHGSTWTGKYDLMYNLPLRRCDNEMIGECPKNYKDPFIKTLCEAYQSLVIHREVENGETKFLIFKNSICAYCHGIETGIDPHPETVPNSPIQPTNGISLGGLDELSWNPSVKIERQLECPIWLGAVYYDLPFWSLSVLDDTRSMLPKFTSTMNSKSRWTPPSFSMLLQFRQDGSNTVTYTDNGNSSAKSIYPDATCNNGEVYDPFYGKCRPVLCDPEESFTDSSCIPTESNLEQHSDENYSSVPITATITLIIEVPSEQVPSNLSEVAFLYNTDGINQSVGRLFSINPTNVTVLNVTVLDASEVKAASPTESGSENFVTFAFTFVLIDPDCYSDEDIIEFVEEINSFVPFQRLMLEADFLTVVVLSTPKIDQIPVTCADGTKKIQYSCEEYEIIDYEGRRIIHINETDEYFLESEYQFLDWSVEITENGTQRVYEDDSRVIVCAEVPEVLACDIYVPLNESEYEIFENETLYLIGRGVTIPPTDYIPFEDTVAVCADHYISNSTSQESDRPIPGKTAAWMTVAVWFTFALSILSLVALAITFITYLLFRDLRTVSGCCIMNLSVAQFSAVSIFIFGANATTNSVACTTVAIILHYLFLSTFFWNNVMAFDVWRIFGQGLKTALRRSIQNRLASEGRTSGSGKIVYKYMIYAWGVPAVLVSIAVAIEFGAENFSIGYIHDPTFGICWISNATANIVVFGVPVFLILLVNGVFFVLSIISIRKSTNAPMKNVAKKEGPFRRELASVSDEIRTQESDDEAKCKSYQKRRTLSESYEQSRCSLSSIDEGQETAESRACPIDRPTQKPEVITAERKQSTSTPRSGFSISRRRFSAGVIFSPGNRVSRKRARSNVLVYVKMSTVMGFSWIIGFAAAFTRVVVLWVLFEISVPLQGIFIFCAFICKKRILQRYKVLSASCREKKKDGNRQNAEEKTRKAKRQTMYIQTQNTSSTSLDNTFEEPTSTSLRRSTSTNISHLDKEHKKEKKVCQTAGLQPSHLSQHPREPRNDTNISLKMSQECHINVNFILDDEI